MTADEIIQRTLTREAGTSIQNQTAKVLADLKRDGWALKRETTKEIAYCQSGNCIKVQLIGGKCPICHWPEGDN